MAIERPRTRLTTPVRALLGLLFVSCCHVEASAQGMDVVIVENGDRITGDVESLKRGELSFSTAAAGTIAITWSQVVTIATKQILDVDTSSGMRYTGTISSPANGELVVHTTTGTTMPIPLTEVVRITSVGDTFFARTFGSVDFGLLATDLVTTYTFHGDAKNRTRSYHTDLLVESLLARQDEGTNQTRNNVKLISRRLFVNRWFVMGLVQGQQDDELELDWRTEVGGGAGRVLIESADTLFLVEGGLDYNGEHYAPIDATSRSAEVFGSTTLEWSPTGPTELTIGAKTEISLDRARVRLDLDATLRRDIFWNLYWTVNVFEDADSDPPDDTPKSSFGLSFGIGWTF